MKITIITASFNSAATIGDTIESIASQTYKNFEHIVVDGASSDNTLQIVGKFGSTQSRIIAEPDKGIYDAMNKGLALATGDVVGFLNSDDYFADSQVLERIAQAFADPQIDMVYGDIVFVSQNDKTQIVRLWTSEPYSTGMCSKGWMPPHPSLYVRRSAYVANGFFDLSFPAAADFEMALRLFDIAQLTSAYLPFVQVRMRMGGQSTGSISNIISGNREVLRACRKHGIPSGLYFVLKRLAAKVPQFFRRPKKAL